MMIIDSFERLFDLRLSFLRNDSKYRFSPESADCTGYEVDQISLLERCAQTTLFLVKELQASTDVVEAMTASSVVLNSDPSSNSLPSLRTSLDQDSERAQFLMKLAPRIRRLETNTISSLSFWTEQILMRLQDRKPMEKNLDSSETKADEAFEKPSESELQLMIGHCMRGLALLGRGKEVENIFARVAIMYVTTFFVLVVLILLMGPVFILSILFFSDSRSKSDSVSVFLWMP